jgi:hypothetical protein
MDRRNNQENTIRRRETAPECICNHYGTSGAASSFASTEWPGAENNLIEYGCKLSQRQATLSISGI